MDAEVLAAGGLVVREREGRSEVAIVHRPRYDDWSLPKGKLEPGETFEQAALREVEEETGLRCALGPELEAASYTDRKGRSKVVHYYEMRPLGGEFEPNHEVDELRWVTLKDALAQLTHEHDRRLVSALSPSG